MGYMSVKQAAEKWQLSEERVEELCREGAFSGVVSEGRTFFIPDTVQSPVSSIVERPSSPEYEELIGRIDAKKKQVDEIREDEEKREAIEDAFLIKFTYESDAIEGNSLTFEETKKVLNGDVVAGKSLKEHLQCVGQRDAFELVRKLVGDRVPLSEQVIKDLHALLLLDWPEERGRYRKESVHIMGAFHQPPEADRVPAKMAKQLGKYTNSELHGIENAVHFLMKFDGIHPFMDANGRMGRILLNYMLMQYGYPPVSVHVEDRDAYYEAMDSYYRDNTAAPMIELIAGYVEERFDEYLNA